MAIDRAARAKRRQEQRAAQEAAAQRETRSTASVALGVEGLFSAGARHQLDQLAWVQVHKEDDREAGGPLDLDSDVVHLERKRP
ncbi:hypothetical protein GCM10011581_33360 [Saccharopolyspora subtropica]|uniref:Uncharacterized protein n=1 Tax=Saccharopolyspora thermophila TaxID=89367 RepID=A0A917NE89_9PSEU|nr:hypothetical protein [Saccharopolyspora subtropica]GGI93634.1 hypothetical protein GCM10011581_33360 [Saccharopolyspora subtropica]